MNHTSSIKDLKRIPGVGTSIAQDLIDLGIYSVKELQGQNAQLLYDKLCSLRGQRIDRCMLYVFKCAIYFAETADPDPELLKWWNWKDSSSDQKID